MLESELECARNCFAQFERHIEDESSPGSPREGIHAVLDILDGNQPEETQRRARNLVSAYRRRFVGKARELVEAGDGVPISRLWHYVDLAEVFADECPEEDGELNSVLGQLRLAAMVEDVRWLSRVEKQQFLRELDSMIKASPNRSPSEA